MTAPIGAHWHALIFLGVFWLLIAAKALSRLESGDSAGGDDSGWLDDAGGCHSGGDDGGGCH